MQSVTLNVLRIAEARRADFTRTFDFYIKALDDVYALFGQTGLTAGELGALSESEREVFKSCLFLVTSAHTTSTGVLMLLASGLHSDAYALLRIMYETLTLLHYANGSAQQGDEVCRTIFKSGLTGRDHARAEWNLVKAAEPQFERDEQGARELRETLNEFGGHASRTKVVGNVAVSGGAAVCTFFQPDFRRPDYLRALDLYHWLLARILQEFDTLCVRSGRRTGVAHQATQRMVVFDNRIRPRLTAMMCDD